MNRLLPRDERESSVDLEAARIAYVILAFGLLLVVMCRSFVNREAPWDLLGLVVLSGLASTAYTAWRRATSARWVLAGALAVVGGALVAAAIVAAGIR